MLIGSKSSRIVQASSVVKFRLTSRSYRTIKAMLRMSFSTSTLLRSCRRRRRKRGLTPSTSWTFSCGDEQHCFNTVCFASPMVNVTLESETRQISEAMKLYDYVQIVILKSVKHLALLAMLPVRLPHACNKWLTVCMIYPNAIAQRW